MGLWDWEGGGPKWSFVIDTDTYAGNFEREMCGYVTGQRAEEGGSKADPYIAMFRKDLKDEDLYEGLVEFRINDPGDDGYTRSPVDIAPTPGWCGNDDYVLRKLEPGEKTECAAYGSVAIFLSRRPTAKEIKNLTKRARAFSGLPKLKPWDARPKILGCRLVGETVQLTSEDV